MKRIPRWPASIVAITGAILVYFLFPIVPFIAAFHDGTGEHRLNERSLATSSEVVSVITVLDRYGERYSRFNDQTLLITPRLYLNKELRWNYTSKAGL